MDDDLKEWAVLGFPDAENYLSYLIDIEERFQRRRGLRFGGTCKGNTMPPGSWPIRAREC
jgi:hypothetical protein